MSHLAPPPATEPRRTLARPIDGDSLLTVGQALIDAAARDEQLGLALSRVPAPAGAEDTEAVRWQVATRLATRPGQPTADVSFGPGVPLGSLADAVAGGALNRWIAGVRARLESGALHRVRAAALDTPTLLRARLAMELAGTRAQQDRLAATAGSTDPASAADRAVRLVFAGADTDAPMVRSRRRRR